MRHTTVCGKMPHALALVLAAGTLASAAQARAAEQFVAFDEVFTIVQKGDGGLEPYHHLIKPGPNEPASWTAPVNLSKGMAYLYVEVMKKPSARKTILTTCFDGDREAYGCIDTTPFTEVGNFESKTAMAEGGLFWNYNAIKWGTKRGEYHIVVKDPALGGTPGGKPPTDFVPITVRLALTVVPAGATYTPPKPSAGGGEADAGGMTPAVDAGAGTGGSPGTGGGPAGQGGQSGSAPSGTGGSSSSSGTGGAPSVSTGGSAGGSPSGSGGSPSSGGTGGTSSPPKGDGTGGSSGSGSPGTSQSSSPAASGCSLAPGHSAPATTFAGLGLAIAGLALIARRRR